MMRTTLILLTALLALGSYPAKGQSVLHPAQPPPANSPNPARYSLPAARLLTSSAISGQLVSRTACRGSELLNRRGCLIPQTYEAHGPENVVHASLERAGSSDWAVLCSAEGTVSLLVFFGSTPAQLVVLASAPETERLQAHDPSGVLGFNWGIDPASPEQIRTAQIGLLHRPALADHDALADSLLDHRTVYHFYAKNAWIVLEMPE